MKVVLKTAVALALTGALVGQAWADGYRGRDHWRPREQRDRGDWIAPLIVVGIAGAMLGAAAAQSNNPSVGNNAMPPPAVVPPAPPANAQFYCRSAGQYYPYTQFCPEGWQVVTPGY